MIAPLLPVVICGVACRAVGVDLWCGEVAQLAIDVLRNACDGSYSVTLQAHRGHPWSTGELLCHVRKATLLECEHAIDAALAEGAEVRANARVTLRERRAA